MCGGGAELRVRLEDSGAELRDFPGRVAEAGRVHVVVAGLRGDDEVPDADAVVEGAGDAGVHDVRDLEEVREDLGADAGVDLADTAAHDDGRGSAKAAVIEVHAGPLHDAGDLHFFFQARHFHFHGADDSQFHSR